MKTEDIHVLLRKHKFVRAKRKPWMAAMPDSEFYMTNSVVLEFNSKSRYLKRLKDFTELNYQYSSLEKIEKLMKGDPVE